MVYLTNDTLSEMTRRMEIERVEDGEGDSYLLFEKREYKRDGGDCSRRNE